MTGGLSSLVAPAITETELRELARRAPAVLQAPLQLTWGLSPRPFAAAARVRTARGMVFVKRHDLRVRDVEALREEHAYIHHLRARGAAVPEVLRVGGGAATAIATDRWSYEFHAPAPGRDLYGEVHSWMPVHGTAHAAALGGALARLHLAAQGYAAPARRARPLLASFDVAGADDFAAGLAVFLGARPAVARFLESTGQAPAAVAAAFAPWHAALRPLLPALAPLWVHNDWHAASNAFWSEEGAPAQVTCAIDFGLCNLGCAMADLATALERTDRLAGAAHGGTPAPRARRAWRPGRISAARTWRRRLRAAMSGSDRSSRRSARRCRCCWRWRTSSLPSRRWTTFPAWWGMRRMRGWRVRNS